MQVIDVTRGVRMTRGGRQFGNSLAVDDRTFAIDDATGER
jgi:hypothetical protein